MSGIDVLQVLTDVLFLGIFIIVTHHAIRQRRRATIDTALLFGVATGLVLYTVLAVPLHLTSYTLVAGLVIALVLALSYLLLRLVEDFTSVPRPVSAVAAVGLVLGVLSAFALPNSVRTLLTLPYIMYFVSVTLYSSVAFVRAARQATGVTQRRLQAVGCGSLCLGLDVIVAGLHTGLPAFTPAWTTLSHLCGLGAGIGYFLGFAPPAWVRRAWQEPELRAFLARAARLPRLPSTDAIVREMEQGVAASLGVAHALVFLWHEDIQVLRSTAGTAPYDMPLGQMIGAHAFATQQALFSVDAPRDDPANADLYRTYGATTVLAAPITAGEKRLGLLLAYAPRASIFAADDLVLVQLLADQAAVILESRTLIDEATRVRAREEVTRLKDDFLSAAAHDLKTPLTSLLGQAQLLQRRAARDPAAPADGPGIDRIVTEAQRLRRLVHDLLDVARVEQGQLVGAREPLDLVTAVADARRHIMSPLHHISIDANAPVMADCDPARIMQLMDNLLENAVKYSPEGRDITVRVWADEEAHLMVIDQGIGIPAADLPRLFERFHRAGNVDDRAFAGMGLGLYICQAIVVQHGGRLTATSDGPGTGSTFHITLPRLAPSKVTTGDRGEKVLDMRSPVVAGSDSDTL